MVVVVCVCEGEAAVEGQSMRSRSVSVRTSDDGASAASGEGAVVVKGGWCSGQRGACVSAQKEGQRAEGLAEERRVWRLQHGGRTWAWSRSRA